MSLKLESDMNPNPPLLLPVAEGTKSLIGDVPVVFWSTTAKEYQYPP